MRVRRAPAVRPACPHGPRPDEDGIGRRSQESHHEAVRLEPAADLAATRGTESVEGDHAFQSADTAVRATDIDEAQVRKAKEEAERVLSHKDPKMSVEEAQAQLAMSIAQLSALERLRKNLKH